MSVAAIKSVIVISWSVKSIFCSVLGLVKHVVYFSVKAFASSSSIKLERSLEGADRKLSSKAAIVRAAGWGGGVVFDCLI